MTFVGHHSGAAANAASIYRRAHDAGRGRNMQPSSASGRAWVTVALLFTFMLINFVDKTVLGLAGVPIMQELGLTPSQFGLIGSSFFFLFSISAIITGFIVNH